MKKLLLIMAALLVASATAYGAVIFNPPQQGNASYGSNSSGTVYSYKNWTGAGSTERFCPDVFHVSGWRYVTVQWKGVTALGNYSSIAGTLKIYGGPSATGPWSPIDVGTTALSYTSDGSVTFENANPYIAVSWTRTRNAVNLYVTPGNVGF